MSEAGPLSLNLREVRVKAASQVMLWVLSHARGNVTPAANLPGIRRPTFYAKARKYRMDIS